MRKPTVLKAATLAMTFFMSAFISLGFDDNALASSVIPLEAQSNTRSFKGILLVAIIVWLLILAIFGKKK